MLRKLFCKLWVVVLVAGLMSVAQVLPPGVPREKTLIIHNFITPAPIPGNWNLWAGWRTQCNGLQQLITEALWTLDPNPEGSIIDGLAVGPAVYNEDFTKLTIKLREGVYWSDGVPFTADDVVFTVLKARDTPGFAFHAQCRRFVKDAYKLDDYTVVIELTEPNPRFHTVFVERWNALRPMPKHIFEKVDDIMAFPFHPPVGTGPYVYVDHDPAGYWTLWRKRADWQRTVTGMLYGEPVPEYILFISYGPLEKNIMAMQRHELDVLDATLEGALVILKTVETARGLRDTWPFFEPSEPTGTGPAFNHLKYPYNIKDVRWALALAIDAVKANIMAFGGVVPFTIAFPLPPLPAFYEWYFKPIEPWLEQLELDLGNGETFRPWDPTVPWRLLEWAKQNYEGVNIDPADEKAVRLTLGYGWWKYAPDVAEKLLKKHGFFRGPDGKWRLPNGEPWVIQYIITTDPTYPPNLLAHAIAEQWRRFGIEVEVIPAVDWATRGQYGNFDLHFNGHSGWVGEPYYHPDLYACFNPLRSDFVRPIGELNLGWFARWSHPKMDQIIKELELTPWDDEQKIIQLGLEGIKLEIEEMIGLPIIQFPLFILVDEYYWTNFPSAENHYARINVFVPWPELKYALHQLKPTGR